MNPVHGNHYWAKTKEGKYLVVIYLECPYRKKHGDRYKVFFAAGDWEMPFYPSELELVSRIPSPLGCGPTKLYFGK